MSEYRVNMIPEFVIPDEIEILGTYSTRYAEMFGSINRSIRSLFVDIMGLRGLNLAAVTRFQFICKTTVVSAEKRIPETSTSRKLRESNR